MPYVETLVCGVSERTETTEPTGRTRPFTAARQPWGVDAAPALRIKYGETRDRNSFIPANVSDEIDKNFMQLIITGIALLCSSPRAVSAQSCARPRQLQIHVSLFEFPSPFQPRNLQVAGEGRAVTIVLSSP